MIRSQRGFALIDLIFVCGIIGVLVGIAIPRLTAAKAAAGVASAIGSLRAINSGELTFALTCGNGFYAPSLTTLGTPPPGSNEPFIGQGLGAADSVTKSGFIMRVSASPFGGSPASCNGLAAGDGGQGYKAAADPGSPDAAPRYFGSNASGLLYEHNMSLWATMPEIGDPDTGHPYQ
jgi:type II secretory pathway pseudopilin PulG